MCEQWVRLVLTSSTIDKKLEIYTKLGIDKKNLENELEIDKKNLENVESSLSSSFLLFRVFCQG